MLSGVTSICALLVCWILCLAPVDGLIELLNSSEVKARPLSDTNLSEIVEEQHCSNYEFRLICRELDGHIAVLEAWYSTIEDYYQPTTNPAPLRLRHDNETELTRVYFYSSPKHNGVYSLSNSSSNYSSDNYTYIDSLVNETFVYNDTLDAVDVNNANCSVESFSRSYGSWTEGDKRKPQREVNRSVSFNLRAPVSYRCAGVNHCSFILAKDYPWSRTWSLGVVYIKYACFDDTLSVHHCNREIEVGQSGPSSEGYVRTPGYPHYYVADECRWRLAAHPEQRIRITIMDVSLRSIGPHESHCTDYVSITDENGEPLLSSCDQVQLPLRLTSLSHAVEIAVAVHSQGAFPKRGVLLHYKSVGCVTPAAPPSGYMVYRNEEVAYYMCNVNSVFVDTRQRARVLWCYDDNTWNDTIAECVEESVEKSGPDTERDKKMAEANIVIDIVIPSLLIAALFIGNAFIVLVIYKYRKRKNDDLEDEFNTIPLSVNGNCTGNAV